jgi:glucose/arabinose dehydrogenase
MPRPVHDTTRLFRTGFGWTRRPVAIGLVPLLLAAALAGLHANGFAQAPRLETVASGLENPWSVAFLPDGRFLVTERPGRMRIVGADGRVGPALGGVPAVAAGGQGGLLDVVVDGDFATSRRLFFCFSEDGAGGNGTALASARLAADGAGLEEVRILFSQKPKVRSSLHFGCRIVLARDGTLFLTLGERYSRSQDAQRLDNHLGKVVRLRKDGSVPPDNPYVGRAGALPEIWSYGHRNPQGAALAPDGTFWMHEHGPQGGDEINVPEAGLNYGWPVITHGEQYGGGPVGEGITARAGLEQPLHHWTPSIAPSGMAFLTSDRYGAAWKGNLFVGSLKFAYLDRIELAGRQVVREHRIEVGERVRDVRQGPDGMLYLLTDAARGRLLRLVP